jgi:hypothetical protein
MPFSSIPEALEDFKAGKMLVVVATSRSPRRRSPRR